ncbi:hypothetical protein Tco_0644460 [Tanacetum coccineum]
MVIRLRCDHSPRIPNEKLVQHFVEGALQRRCRIDLLETVNGKIMFEQSIRIKIAKRNEGKQSTGNPSRSKLPQAVADNEQLLASTMQPSRKDSRQKLYYRREDLEAYQAQLKQTRETNQSIHTIETDSRSIRRIGSTQYAVSTRQNNTLLYMSRQMMVPFPSRLDNHYCKEEEGNYGLKFTEAYGASHINNVIPLTEERSKGHRRNQGDDLMPTIEEGEVIEEFRTRDEDLDTRIDDYPSYVRKKRRSHIDCAHKNFRNIKMQNKMVYKGDNVVGTFSVMTDFAVLEDMDAYRDEGMGDIIVGEPFLREVGIKAKRFKGIITLYNGDDEVTYQMVRSHPRFKNHTNKQCNKIPPLLKVSEKDVKNGILHAYQKLKGFYKGVFESRTIYHSKMRRWKNGSYAVTLACMRWNKKRS